SGIGAEVGETFGERSEVGRVISGLGTIGAEESQEVDTEVNFSQSSNYRASELSEKLARIVNFGLGPSHDSPVNQRGFERRARADQRVSFRVLGDPEEVDAFKD